MDPANQSDTLMLSNVTNNREADTMIAIHAVEGVTVRFVFDLEKLK